MSGFQKQCQIKYRLVTTSKELSHEEVQKLATKYVKLKDKFYHPFDKGTLEPRNGGYEAPLKEELQKESEDVLFEESTED